jgi:hypothetical protein
MKKVKWDWDWGVYIPLCPYCNEPAYEKDHCVFCGKPYEWVEGKYKDTIVKQGEYTIIQATNNHISIYKNGEFVMHSQCNKKMTEKELLDQVKFYNLLIKKDEDGKTAFDKIYEEED